MTIPFGIVLVRDHFCVCLCDSVVAAGVALIGGRDAPSALAARFAETVRTSVHEVAAVQLGSPLIVDLDVVVDALVDRGCLVDLDADAMVRSLADRCVDAPLLVETLLDGGAAAVEQLVGTWLGEIV